MLKALLVLLWFLTLTVEAKGTQHTDSLKLNNGLRELSSSDLRDTSALAGTAKYFEQCVEPMLETIETLPSYDASKFEIEFGVISGCRCDCSLDLKTTRVLPKKFGKENMRFGFLIKPKTCATYANKVVLHSPSVTDEIIESKEVKRFGVSSQEAFLEKGDQSGTYRMTLFINGETASDVEFEVQ